MGYGLNLALLQTMQSQAVDIFGSEKSKSMSPSNSSSNLQQQKVTNGSTEKKHKMQCNQAITSLVIKLYSSFALHFVNSDCPSVSLGNGRWRKEVVEIRK